MIKSILCGIPSLISDRSLNGYSSLEVLMSCQELVLPHRSAKLDRYHCRAPWKQWSWVWHLSALLRLLVSRAIYMYAPGFASLIDLKTWLVSCAYTATSDKSRQTSTKSLSYSRLRIIGIHSMAFLLLIQQPTAYAASVGKAIKPPSWRISTTW